MHPPQLTKEQIQRLLKFKGYGNPAGCFWFIGMEEGGSPRMCELLERATVWDEIEDLAGASRPWDLKFPDPKLRKWMTWTWWNMCRIVGRLRGNAQWSDKEVVREYQFHHLGRRGDESFLTEILPLPKPNTGAWPYEYLYPTRQAYEDAVRPDRIEGLRELFADHKPKYVFCYGKTNWKHYKSVFRDAEFAPILDGAAEIATLGNSTVVLTNFFSPWCGVIVEFIERLCHKVSAAAPTGQDAHGARSTRYEC